ncbi:hypothetical protein DMUE_0987 [Dictyocoela muelleri]|nr:hypothetical protein DMUE_0987 [Dictyocoela muelleri]
MTPDEFKNMLIRMKLHDFIDYLMTENYIKKELICVKCLVFIELKALNNVKDSIAWRCMTLKCTDYKKRISIRMGSFFETLKISFLQTFKILIRLSTDVPQHAIVKGLGLDKRTIKMVKVLFLNRVGSFDFKDNNLGGLNKDVQIDETGLNFKIKPTEEGPLIIKL